MKLPITILLVAFDVLSLLGCKTLPDASVVQSTPEKVQLSAEDLKVLQDNVAGAKAHNDKLRELRLEIAEASTAEERVEARRAFAAEVRGVAQALRAAIMVMQEKLASPLVQAGITEFAAISGAEFDQQMATLQSLEEPGGKLDVLTDLAADYALLVGGTSGELQTVKTKIKSSIDDVSGTLDLFLATISTWIAQIAPQNPGGGQPVRVTLEGFFVAGDMSDNQARARDDVNRRCESFIEELGKTVLDGARIEISECPVKLNVAEYPNVRFAFVASPKITYVYDGPEGEWVNGELIAGTRNDTASRNISYRTLLAECQKSLEAAKSRHGARFIAGTCGDAVNNIEAEYPNVRFQYQSRTKLLLRKRPVPAGIPLTLNTLMAGTGAIERQEGIARMKWEADCLKAETQLSAVYGADHVLATDCGKPVSRSAYPNIQVNYGSQLKTTIAVDVQPLSQTGADITGTEASHSNLYDSFASWNRQCMAATDAARTKWGARFIAVDCGTVINVASYPNVRFQWQSKVTVYFRPLQ